MPKDRAVAEPELLLTQAEVADQLRATPRQVRRWLDERKLAFVMLPQGRVVPADAVERFVASRYFRELAPEEDELA
jgi:excisionase family DNA binding protein